MELCNLKIFIQHDRIFMSLYTFFDDRVAKVFLKETEGEGVYMLPSDVRAANVKLW